MEVHYHFTTFIKHFYPFIHYCWICSWFSKRNPSLKSSSLLQQVSTHQTHTPQSMRCLAKSTKTNNLRFVRFWYFLNVLLHLLRFLDVDIEFRLIRTFIEIVFVKWRHFVFVKENLIIILLDRFIVHAIVELLNLLLLVKLLT